MSKNETGINDLDDFAPHLRPTLEKSLDGMSFLDQLTQESAAQIPEPIFVEHILPVLANREGNQSLAKWQQVAGHAMRAIEVTDAKTNEVLFRVPPLLRSINEEFTGKGARSAFEIIRTAEQKRRVMPAMGDAHLRANLTNRVRHIPAPVKDVVAWNEILKRYGYDPILKRDVAPVPEENNSDPTTMDIDGFDDF